jgi:hypothetical protein
MKYIIVDSRISDASKQVLQNFGKIIEFESSGIVYDAISGHPDIFLFQDIISLIVAPNAPSEFLNELEVAEIKFKLGTTNLGFEYPNTAKYNAVSTKNLFIHNLKISDETLLEINKNRFHIHVNQGYTRCNLLALNNKAFISSDWGICRELERHKLKSLYINPENIQLQGMKHGFFGGCCGILNQYLFLNGSIDSMREKNAFFDFALNEGFHLVELNDGPLTDIGSIMVIDSNSESYTPVD